MDDREQGSAQDETVESGRPHNLPSSRMKDSVRITAQPHSEVEPYPAKIPVEERRAVGYDLMQQIRQAISDMNAMNCNYDLYESLYEMHVEQRSGPQGEYCSNVFVPLIPEMIDTMTARLAAVIFQPRFFIANGNTEQGAAVAAKVERAFNAWLTQLGWIDPLFTWLQQSLLYGNGIMGVFWKRKTVKRKRYVDIPRIDPVTGLAAVDLDTGKPIVDRKLVNEPVVEFDDVELVPIPAKEFVVFPIWARSIDTALGVARKVRLSEQELQAMVREGTLWADAVERALSYNPEGENERPTDIEGVEEITADDQMNITQGSINESPYRRQRGPLEVWQVHTGQYDFDNDGEFEENILWVHEMSQELLGHAPYAYWHGHRPYVAGIPMPRDQIFPGFSVGDRLRTIQAEVNTKENQKNDAIDRAISPTLVYTRGTECKTQANRIGPGAEWEVEGQVGTSISFLQYPDVPLSTWEETEWLYQRAMTIMGLNAPMMGAQSAGRRTRGEVMLQAQSAGVRLDLIANRMRQAMKEIAWQILQLKIQYGPDEKEVKDYSQTGLPQKLIISREELSQDIDVDIAGNGGPLDRAGRQQDTMVLYSLLMQNPLVQAKMTHVYAATRMMLDDHDRSDVPALIGTMEEAAQLDAARQQAAQAQQAQLQQRAAQQPTQQLQQMARGQQQPPQIG